MDEGGAVTVVPPSGEMGSDDDGAGLEGEPDGSGERTSLGSVPSFKSEHAATPMNATAPNVNARALEETTRRAMGRGWTAMPPRHSTLRVVFG